MLRRAMMVGALVLTVLAIGTPAQAPVNTCCWFNSDIQGQIIITALGNVAVTRPAYEVVLFPRQLAEQCFPPGGSTPQSKTGVPFFPDASSTEGGEIPPDEVSKNGRFVTDLMFPDDDLRQTVGGSFCKDNGTGWIPGDLVMLVGQAFATVFECEGFPSGSEDDPRTAGCPIADGGKAQIGQCLRAPESWGFQPDVHFDYNVTTLCNDKTGNPTSCPDEPQAFPEETCPLLQ